MLFHLIFVHQHIFLVVVTFSDCCKTIYSSYCHFPSSNYCSLTYVWYCSFSFMYLLYFNRYIQIKNCICGVIVTTDQIMCPNGTTCLPADCLFSEPALCKFYSGCWSRTKWTLSHQKFILFSPWHSWTFAHLELNNKISLIPKWHFPLSNCCSCYFFILLWVFCVFLWLYGRHLM